MRDVRCAAWCAIVLGMTVFDDLAAEQERLEAILGGLDEGQWMSASGAAGWTVADVVLHLAQSEEAVVATVSGADLRAGQRDRAGGTVDELMAELVQAQRGPARTPRPGRARAGRAAGRGPGPAAAVGGGAGQAGHAGNHAAGRTLGARPGHHRAAAHRVP